jgi:hypothetical protein
MKPDVISVFKMFLEMNTYEVDLYENGLVLSTLSHGLIVIFSIPSRIDRTRL